MTLGHVLSERGPDGAFIRSIERAAARRNLLT